VFVENELSRFLVSDSQPVEHCQRSYWWCLYEVGMCVGWWMRIKEWKPVYKFAANGEMLKNRARGLVTLVWPLKKGLGCEW